VDGSKTRNFNYSAIPRSWESNIVVTSILGCSRICRHLSGFVGTCWDLLGFVGFCWVLLGFVGTKWQGVPHGSRFSESLSYDRAGLKEGPLSATRDLLGFVGICWGLLGFVGVCWGLWGLLGFVGRNQRGHYFTFPLCRENLGQPRTSLWCAGNTATSSWIVLRAEVPGII
jgi:hypothetical protein